MKTNDKKRLGWAKNDVLVYLDDKGKRITKQEWLASVKSKSKKG